MKSVELFVGAGGLAQGVHSAGFHHEAVIDWNKDAYETLLLNQRSGAEWLKETRVLRTDVTAFDFTELGSDIDLLAGGPPCQPFSIGGQHRGNLDPRDMFPHFIRAMRDLRPKAVVVENVQGLSRAAFSNYLSYIILRMTYPEVEPSPESDWMEHLSLLQALHRSSTSPGLSYRLEYQVLNAADYGVPQRRKRVFIVGYRSDLGLTWEFPAATHSHDALLQAKWVTGEYWHRHELPVPTRPPTKTRTSTEQLLLRSPRKAWLTVRDAICDLPEPVSEATQGFHNHVFQAGARSYPGHTGSPIDEPAKTLKAGVHGVPGGENMIAYQDGSVRYFTAREAARIQTFPDGYVLSGAWSEMMRQLGNAVPVRLAHTIANRVHSQLLLRLQRSELAA